MISDVVNSCVGSIEVNGWMSKGLVFTCCFEGSSRLIQCDGWLSDVLAPREDASPDQQPSESNHVWQFFDTNSTAVRKAGPILWFEVFL